MNSYQGQPPPQRRQFTDAPAGDQDQPEDALTGRSAPVALETAAVGSALRVVDVVKRFGGVRALDGASLEVTRGRVHALLGENGAGKSTLVKVVAGVIAPDSGDVVVEGRLLTEFTPQASRRAGVAVVYQELSLFPHLTVAHNLFLTELPRGPHRLVSMSATYEAARQALTDLRLDEFDPRGQVGDLPLDRRQILEIAKAVLRRPRILILDEATSSLSAAEVDWLMDLVGRLRRDGTTVVVISHRMDEIWQVADELTILRDGRTVATGRTDEISAQEAVSLMAGRDVQTSFPVKQAEPAGHRGDNALELKDVRLRAGARSWDLAVRRGEVLGLGGLEGQGQREVLRWIYGMHWARGRIIRNGRPFRVRGPRAALKAGIAYIPEDRKAEGLHLDLSVRWNIAMATLPRRSLLGFIRRRAEGRLAADVIGQLSVKVDSADAPASSLSGGTQQKVVLGKFLATEPEVLLFADPTRGVDVRTKFEFYGILRSLTSQGKACVVYSSDTSELVGVSDRVAVFHDGTLTAVLEGAEITQEALVAASFAVSGAAQ